jgi:fluoroacetyl-CoA thioesterase
MTNAIEAGAEFIRSFIVDAARTIGFMGPELRVYATPAIVHDVETACRDWLLGRIEAEMDSVGVRVEIEHRRGTPLGTTVAVSAKVAAVDGRRIGFDVVVSDPIEVVATVRHQRMIVDKTRLAAAIRDKRAKLAQS